MDKTKEWYLFLDDERYPENVSWAALPAVKWTIVRTFFEFRAAIVANGLPVFISFDHDLGDMAMQETVTSGFQSFNYNNLKGEKTGMDYAKWLVEYCMEFDLDVPEFSVHSINPIGKENIKNYLYGYIKFRKENK